MSYCECEDIGSIPIKSILLYNSSSLMVEHWSSKLKVWVQFLRAIFKDEWQSGYCGGLLSLGLLARGFKSHLVQKGCSITGRIFVLHTKGMGSSPIISNIFFFSKGIV